MRNYNLYEPEKWKVARGKPEVVRLAPAMEKVVTDLDMRRFGCSDTWLMRMTTSSKCVTKTALTAAKVARSVVSSQARGFSKCNCMKTGM